MEYENDKNDPNSSFQEEGKILEDVIDGKKDQNQNQRKYGAVLQTSEFSDETNLYHRLQIIKQCSEICVTPKGKVFDGRSGNLIAEMSKIHVSCRTTFGYYCGYKLLSYVVRDPKTTEEMISFEKSRRCNGIAKCLSDMSYWDIYLHIENNFLGRIKYSNTCLKGPKFEIYGNNGTKLYNFYIPSWKKGGKELSKTGKYPIYNIQGYPLNSIGPISFNMDPSGTFIAKAKIGLECPLQHCSLLLPALIQLIN